MDSERRLELVKGVGEEIITVNELKELLETKSKPIAYDGFEPSGFAHLPFGVLRPLLIKDLIKANIHFKLWLADWYGWINNKMGGDLNKIKAVGGYFIEVWKAAGVPTDKVEFLWASDGMDSKEYWRKVVLIAKNTTVQRATRCLTIMGRQEGELKEVAQYFYPMMQCADIFHLNADITQLGVDQRRVNVLAREVGPKLGWWKPVVVSHHMLMGLEGPAEKKGFDENTAYDKEISSKMSKSKPSTCIFVHDTKEQLKEKIKGAYCPPKVIEDNPMLDYSKHIIFRAFESMKIERDRKFGGNLEFYNYAELEKAFREGKLHPLDLKVAVADYLELLIKPIREHFEKNAKAKKLYENVKALQSAR